MFWSVLIIIFFIAVMAFAAYVFIKDRRYRNERVSKVMRKEVKDELDEELEAARHRREKFEGELKKAEELDKDKTK